MSDTAQPPVEAAQPETAEDGQPPLVGVLVIKERSPNGDINVRVDPAGVEPTEVQTLLEFGLRAWRERLGLTA